MHFFGINTTAFVVIQLSNVSLYKLFLTLSACQRFLSMDCSQKTEVDHQSRKFLIPFVR